MEVRIEEPESPLSYPYWKVVLSGDRAEVAEFPCEGESTENVVSHDDLVGRLLGSEAPTGGAAEFTAGWLAAGAGEAVLYLHLLAGELDRLDPQAVGRALEPWCVKSGVDVLVIADVSRRSRPDSWDLP